MRQSEKALVAACGGYCGGCTDYVVHINDDEKLKRKLAEEFSKQFNMDIKPEDVGCLGCHGPIHKPWCANCSIRQCTEERARAGLSAMLNSVSCIVLRAEREQKRREIIEMRKVKGIPIWVIVAVLVCIVAIAVAAYVFETVKFPVEVEEPLSVVSYPALLNFYPNTTEAFNITVENVASVNYLVSLAFSLNDTAYQQTYVTFSSETYTVVPGLNNLTAWIYVAADASAKALELTVELNRVSEVEPTFSHTFIWTNETQSLVNGTLVMKVDFRLTEEHLLIAAQINKTDYYLDSASLGIIIDQEFDGFHRRDQGYVLFADNMCYTGSETSLIQRWFVSGIVLMDPHPSPYHNCTFDNATGYTFYVELPKSVIPEKTDYSHVLRAHIDFSVGYYDVNVEFDFENWSGMGGMSPEVPT